MDKSELDDGARRVFRRNAPVLERTTFCADLQAKLVGRKRLHRPRPRRRLLAWACAALLLVAALSVGIFELATHLPGPATIIMITDQTAAQEPTSSSASTSASTAPAATTTTFPKPLPPSAWPYPDYSPVPEPVPSAQVQALAELVAAHFPSLELQVDTAAEIHYPSNTILLFDLSPRGSGQAFVSATIFKSDQGIPHPQKDQAFEVEIPGAAEAGLIERAKPSGSGYDSFQLLAWMPDGTVVNATSTRTAKSRGAEPPLDQEGLKEMVTYLVGLIAGKEVSLPDISLSTSTTLAWTYLPHEIANACWGIAGNAVSYVAYGKKAQFEALLVPEAQSQADAVYQAERERFQTSGMSADHYSSLYAVVIVQWKNGAYLTDLGYFTQTKPPVPQEIDQWLEEDPIDRAAAGVTMWDKTVRWLRLEVQADESWLLVP
ncbi:MAG: hypothetical protein M1274_10470 [Actinobacteria bacterium]|nr:hypothetical protein [Actinomycetota bacterium]